jgi:hypothetical protein
MAMFNFKRSISLPFASAYRAQAREEHMNRRNIKLIRDFLNKQKAQQADNSKELAYLKQQRESRSIDKVTYDRLEEVLLLSREMKQLEMLGLVASKIART